MNLHMALAQIAEIRQQMSRSRHFRGFRALTTLATALAAILGGILQAWKVHDAAAHPVLFVVLWTGIAIACTVLCGWEIFIRRWHEDSPAQRNLTPLAIEQLLPPILVAGLTTLVICIFSPSVIWILPGLWQIFFGLAHLAIRRMFPLAIFFVGLFYIFCGLANLSGGVRHFSPLCMAVPFGVGQMLDAMILYWYLERRHVTP